MISLDASQFPAAKFVRQGFIFSSGLSSATAGVGTTAVAQILISQDAPFECRSFSLSVIQAGLRVLNFAGTFQIAFAGKGEQWGNVAFNCNTLLSDGQLPFHLSPPQVFSESMTINLTLTANVATVTTFQFDMVGNKLFGKAA